MDGRATLVKLTGLLIVSYESVFKAWKRSAYVMDVLNPADGAS